MAKIGWRRYMEGMILSEALVIQAECVDLGGCLLSLDNWAKDWLKSYLKAPMDSGYTETCLCMIL